MVKTSAILLIGIFLISSVAICLADEDKNGKLTHDGYHNILGHGSS